MASEALFCNIQTFLSGGIVVTSFAKFHSFDQMLWAGLQGNRSQSSLNRPLEIDWLKFPQFDLKTERKNDIA